MHPWLHHVSTDGGSCPLSYLPLLARTSGKSLEQKMVAYSRALQYLVVVKKPTKGPTMPFGGKCR